MYLCWFTWNFKNDWAFNHKQPCNKSVITNAVTAVEELNNCNSVSIKGGNLFGEPEMAWQLSLQGVLEINRDGAWMERTKEGAYGIIVRDCEGRVLMAEAKTVVVASVLMTELMQSCESARLLWNRAVVQSLLNQTQSSL
ncbi:unnamed protein product [Ilex paraguariensis]|uniref:RNase H type-1 domain-containing protein n=1 Tax=Ilex paraguariensis TaxID=185542 RepID=A0ABC8RZT9_9AQUA